ncbi:hypothetical protein AC1031_019811 [Aphanomyces cochlioides]|nr:hypothetical protein AC1031_019811 [Aphanomyces cochlioides]
MPPLPTAALFNCPPLSQKERNDLVKEAKIACKYLVINATTSEKSPIDSVVRNVKTGRHATIRRASDKADPQYEGYTAHTKVRASIDDVAEFFVLDSPIKAHAYSRVMGEVFLDKRTLYTLVERPIADCASQPLHSVSIEWLLVRMPMGIPTRDACLLECHDEFVFADQDTGEPRRGWARCSHSISLSCCPELHQSHGVVRMDVIRSGHVFLESSERGVLDYYRVTFGNPNGNVMKHFSKALVNRHLKNSVTKALNIEEFFISQRIKPMLEVSVARFQSKKKVDYCMHCYGRFSWLSSKKQCRGCGDVTCSKCSRVWQLELAHAKVVKVQLCLECITGEVKSRSLQSPRQSMTSTMSHSYLRSSMMLTTSPRSRSVMNPSFSGSILTTNARSYSHSADLASEMEDQATELQVLSPMHWRDSDGVSSAIRDGMLTFQSDSSSIYLYN